MNKCKICKKELNPKRRFVWILAFYGEDKIEVCEECNMCLEEQLEFCLFG